MPGSKTEMDAQSRQAIRLLSVQSGTTMTEFERRVEEANNALLRAKVLAHCHVIGGVAVRGTIDRVRCQCGVLRWDNGTRCESCGQYMYRDKGDEDGGTQS